jgi:hypothetical protein
MYQTKKKENRRGKKAHTRQEEKQRSSLDLQVTSDDNRKKKTDTKCKLVD